MQCFSLDKFSQLANLFIYLFLGFSSHQISKIDDFILFLGKLARFLYWLLACSQKCKGCLNFLTFIYFYSQFWLNYLWRNLKKKKHWIIMAPLTPYMVIFFFIS